MSSHITIPAWVKSRSAGMELQCQWCCNRLHIPHLFGYRYRPPTLSMQDRIALFTLADKMYLPSSHLWSSVFPLPTTGICSSCVLWQHPLFLTITSISPFPPPPSQIILELCENVRRFFQGRTKTSPGAESLSAKETSAIKELVNVAGRVPDGVKYILHTGVGGGPRVITDSVRHLHISVALQTAIPPPRQLSSPPLTLQKCTLHFSNPPPRPLSKSSMVFRVAGCCCCAQLAGLFSSPLF